MPWRGGYIGGSESHSGIRLRVSIESGHRDQTHVAQRETAITPLGRHWVLQMLHFANDHMRTVDFERVMFPQQASDFQR